MLNEINLNCDENMCPVCFFVSSLGQLKRFWESLPNYSTTQQYLSVFNPSMALLVV